MKRKPRFLITVEASPQADDAQGFRRLRLALKVLGRRFGLRCVAVQPEPSDDRRAAEEYAYKFASTAPGIAPSGQAE